MAHSGFYECSFIERESLYSSVLTRRAGGGALEVGRLAFGEPGSRSTHRRTGNSICLEVAFHEVHENITRDITRYSQRFTGFPL